MAELRLERHQAKRFGEVTGGEGFARRGERRVHRAAGPERRGYKTTTLRLAAGLEMPDTGRVHIGGHDVTWSHRLRDVTFVFQQYSLYPHLSV